MWTDDLDVVESCDFYRSLLNFDSIDSIAARTDTDTFVYVKTPMTIRPSFRLLLFSNAEKRPLSTKFDIPDQEKVKDN